jgi:hypothetical protein
MLWRMPMESETIVPLTRSRINIAGFTKAF